MKVCDIPSYVGIDKYHTYGELVYRDTNESVFDDEMLYDVLRDDIKVLKYIIYIIYDILSFKNNILN